MLKLQKISSCSKYARSIFCRQQSTASANQKLEQSHFEVEHFKDFTIRRHSEAERSLMLEVNTKDVCGQVYNHCKQFGDIKNAFVYTLKDERSLMLFEYETEDAIKETFKYSGFQPNTVNWPNRVLTVRTSKLNPSLSNDAPLQIDNAVEPPIANILRNAESFDEQVSLLYQHTRLTDLSVRLKYLSALQAQLVINEYLEDIFPNAKVYPFGSSVNGFGKMGCDLDMALRFDEINDHSDEINDMPLLFQGKEFHNAEDIKIFEGRQVKCIASLIDYLVPGSHAVSAYAAAHVPIVHYYDANIHSSVDLSVNNLDGFHITEYMYSLGLLDPRIRPFIFMVRRWAKEFELTRHNGRANITNFQLSYMCLCFLQQLKEPLVPTFGEVMHQMCTNESKDDSNIVKSAFIFDSDKFQFKTKNTNTVLELFIQFLEYYEAFDFKKHMVTIRTVDKISKTEISPLMLENVYDTTTSWGGNVSESECATMKIMMREAIHEMEQCSTKPTINQDWGLLEIMSKIK